jgi:hypothetical protein
MPNKSEQCFLPLAPVLLAIGMPSSPVASILQRVGGGLQPSAVIAIFVLEVFSLNAIA